MNEHEESKKSIEVTDEIVASERLEQMGDSSRLGAPSVTSSVCREFVENLIRRAEDEANTIKLKSDKVKDQ